MATWEECNKPIDPIVPPPSPPEPSGDCPDLSSDTVAPEKLLVGYTAHDANGDEIVGTLTGTDFFKASITITNAFTNRGLGIALVQWNGSNELREQNDSISASSSKTFIIPRGYNYIAITADADHHFSGMTSGVKIGQPDVTFGTSTKTVIQVRGANTPQTLTIGPE